MTGHVKITRRIEETRRYERTTDVELVVKRRIPRADALTVTVTERIPHTVSHPAPTVTLYVERYRKDGQRAETGSKVYSIGGLAIPRGWEFDAKYDFNDATIERLTALAKQVLDEYAQIDWDNVEPYQEEN